MATVAELWGEPEVKPKGGSSDVISPKQKSFSTYKNGIVINEQTAPQQPQGSTIADLWESTPAATPAQLKEQSGSIVGDAIKKGFESRLQIRDAVLGAGEAGLTALTGAVAAPLAAATGVVSAVRSGKYGTKEGVQAGEAQAKNLMGQMTYQPRTEKGQEYVQNLQQAFEASKLPPAGVPEAAGLASTIGPATSKTMNAPSELKASFKNLKAELPTVRVERTGKPSAMQSGGAAAATNQAMLDEAIGRASPDLAAELKSMKPEQVNKAALENQIVADTLPVPVRLTKGQATQDPTLISFERNERGMKEKMSQHFNEQNKALQENANLIKQKTSEGTFETDYVANSERAIESFKEINNLRQAEIKSAYDALDQLGAGKIEVDSRVFGENAMKALTANEDIDFLPPVIKSKIESYQDGKAMNFAQYENLRTQIARETRKAQRADDGNAVHALTLARSELEKLPLLNETADAKIVADKARSLAKAEFDLLDKRKDTYNSVYADIVNGGADTKDFIPKVVLRSKNADFTKAMDLLQDNPDAIKQLRAGTLDYIIRESTDKSGNFLTGKFTQMVNNLDVNKKLTTLFGEDAQQIKDLAKTGQLIEARPRGSFVNESNTSVANMASNYAKGAAETGVNIAAKGLPIGTIGRQFLERRAANKQVAETLKPGAGVKLSDIPRIELTGMANKEK
jgi:hypothetical protein